MIIKFYSVRDSAAGAFLPPFCAPTDGLAIRSFMEAVNDQTHSFHKHSSDYTLYLLGEFDDNNGALSPQETPIKLLSAFEALIKDITPK